MPKSFVELRKELRDIERTIDRAQGQEEALQEQLDEIVKEMAVLDVTPETIEDEVNELAAMIESDLNDLETKIQELKGEIDK